MTACRVEVLKAGSNMWDACIVKSQQWIKKEQLKRKRTIIKDFKKHKVLLQTLKLGGT